MLDIVRVRFRWVRGTCLVNDRALQCRRVRLTTLGRDVVPLPRFSIAPEQKGGQTHLVWSISATSSGWDLSTFSVFPFSFPISLTSNTTSPLLASQ